MGSLTADELEAAQVHAHCKEKLDAAAEQLESVWEEVVQQVVQMEFVSSLADAVKARNTLALVEATLRLSSGSASASGSAPPLVQRLVFQASVLEEAWLVRQSILQAVLEGKVEDIELWAEQAQRLGEDLHLELAYADRLRQASQQTSKSSSSSWSTENDELRADASNARLPKTCDERCKEDASKHSWDCSTTHPHSPSSAEPTPRAPRPQQRAPAPRPAPQAPHAKPWRGGEEHGQRRDPAPYSASGVQLKHAVWKADERPVEGPFPESKRCCPASTASFPRFAAYEQSRTTRRPSFGEADWDFLKAKAEQQRSAFQPSPGPRLSRPASAPARGREPASRTPAGARTATRAKAQSLFGSWWKSWMGAATSHGAGRPGETRSGPGSAGARARPREDGRGENFKGKGHLVSKLESRESDLMILGFAKHAKPTPDELKKAYKAMAMRWHPDRPHNRDKGAEATANFRTVKAAYDHLTRMPSRSEA